MSDLNKYSPPPQSADLYLAASKHFQQARMILENIPNQDQEVNEILKASKNNIVVMKLLAGGHKKDSKVSCEGNNPADTFSQEVYLTIEVLGD
ncbi:hypothetical protein GDO78_015284 [Eleutherodactylus coqui]|uniref:N-alpha-acetyltransferase 35, NatC auxiliary subunit n=1 Tax=Eleutherodactylus coqui TaxID=57060 RepID=A0A8J6E409_ELECQ|nr:hypothetical protein GDO78_015284 [Eleutherodactylus coqui]